MECRVLSALDLLPSSLSAQGSPLLIDPIALVFFLPQKGPVNVPAMADDHERQKEQEEDLSSRGIPGPHKKEFIKPDRHGDGHRDTQPILDTQQSFDAAGSRVINFFTLLLEV